MSVPRLTVTVDSSDPNYFVCVREGETGMCIQGRGATVLEAVGSWAIYAQAVEAVCDPPELLGKFQMVPATCKRGVTDTWRPVKAPSRGD